MSIIPICLSLNTIQLIALDYLVALYLFFALACFYILLRAHDRDCRLVVRLWKPFLWCTARLRQQWNVRYSIIDAFATFLLLSQIITSIDLLLHTKIFNVRGSRVGYFLHYDTTVEFFGHQHMPYAIVIFNPRACGAHARGLRYLVCVCVCVSVCLSGTTSPATTRNEASN